MKWLIATALVFKTVFASAALAQPVYTLTLQLTETSETQRVVTTIERDIPLENGSFTNENASDDERYRISGKILIDEATHKAHADLHICQVVPGQCEVMVTPNMVFDIGTPAALQIGNERFLIRVSLSPKHS